MCDDVLKNSRTGKGVGRWTRRWCVAYLVALLVLTGVFRWVGEQVWWLVFWLFMPMGFWLLPMLVLGPMAWFRDRRMLWVLAAGGLWMVLVFGGWRPERRQGLGHEGVKAAKGLTLVTFNTGEDNGTSVNAFLRQHRPDLFLMQSARFSDGKSSSLKSVYPEGLYVKRASGFVIESRYPVEEVKLIRDPGWHLPVAVRFRIDLEGQPVTVYSVHLPTPRKGFVELSQGYGPGGAVKARLGRLRKRLEDRAAVTERLLEQLRREEGPVLVVGDFNMPSWGWLYGEVTREWHDVYGATGGGFGFTFPAYDPYFPTFYGPWLRLDYVFCNGRWRALESAVEKKRASQHRAVMAKVELLP